MAAPSSRLTPFGIRRSRDTRLADRQTAPRSPSSKVAGLPRESSRDTPRRIRIDPFVDPRSITTRAPSATRWNWACVLEMDMFSDAAVPRGAPVSPGRPSGRRPTRPSLDQKLAPESGDPPGGGTSRSAGRAAGRLAAVPARRRRCRLPPGGVVTDPRPGAGRRARRWAGCRRVAGGRPAAGPGVSGRMPGGTAERWAAAGAARRVDSCPACQGGDEDDATARLWLRSTPGVGSAGANGAATSGPARRGTWRLHGARTRRDGPRGRAPTSPTSPAAGAPAPAASRSG